jgi:hypothetical protein
MKRIIFLTFLFICIHTFTQDTGTTFKPFEYPAGFTSHLNVVCIKVKGWEGKMEIYMPPKSKKATPVVINMVADGTMA